MTSIKAWGGRSKFSLKCKLNAMLLFTFFHCLLVCLLGKVITLHKHLTCKLEMLGIKLMALS